MIKANPRNMMTREVEEDFFKKFNAIADDGYKEMAKKCAIYAVSAINSHTGNLKLSIKVRKSKFENGGWLCMADSGKKGTGHHAFLVEYGTEGPRFPLLKKVMRFEIDGEIIYAKVVKKMPAKPFMRPSRDKVVAEVIRDIT